MNILLDECTPRILKKRLPGRDISTVQEMGWAGVKNGELLAAAVGGRQLKIIFQLKPGNVVRIITGWDS